MATMERERVGAILLRHGVVEAEALEQALAESRRTGEPLLRVLRRAGLISVFDAAFALLTQSTAALAGSDVGQCFAGLPVQR